MQSPRDVVIDGLKRGDILADRYKMLSLAGSGGMGRVFVAEDLKLNGKRWAVKEIKKVFASDDFIREAKLLSQLNHPCLPNIIDYYAPNERGYAYLVMDYISGKTLKEWFLANDRQASLPDVLHIALQLCRCFTYLHQSLPQPIVYRDLKPSNVMLDETGQVRLIDFGIATLYENEYGNDPEPLGTKVFAAPEQLAGKHTDPRTDLYALGALMYYLLSGGRHYNETQKTLAASCPDLPKSLVRIVDRLLSKKRTRRVQTAVDLEKELLKLQGFEQKQELSLSSVHRQPSKLIVIGGLYAGAGSTFAAIQFARLLDQAGVLHTVTEFPTHKEPELYYILNGDMNCPKDYIFYTERPRPKEKYEEWTSGRTIWRPLRPVSTPKDYSEYFNPMNWLQHIHEPITIVDVSDAWDDDNVGHLCEKADLICVVADPQRAKFNGIRARKNVKHAIQLKQRGKAVQFIANRVLPKQKLSSWFEAFPWPPAGTIPNVEFSAVVEADRKGKLVQDMPTLRNVCEKSLAALLKIIK